MQDLYCERFVALLSGCRSPDWLKSATDVTTDSTLEKLASEPRSRTVPLLPSSPAATTCTSPAATPSIGTTASLVESGSPSCERLGRLPTGATQLWPLSPDSQR